MSVPRRRVQLSGSSMSSRPSKPTATWFEHLNAYLVGDDPVNARQAATRAAAPISGLCGEPRTARCGANLSPRPREVQRLAERFIAGQTCHSDCRHSTLRERAWPFTSTSWA